MLRPALAIGVLVGLLGGQSQALTSEQQVAIDLLRSLGGTQGQCARLVPHDLYQTLKAQDQAGKLVCGTYTGGIRKARESCEATYKPAGLTWETSRNKMNGTLVRGNYIYKISVTCMGKDIIIRIQDKK